MQRKFHLLNSPKYFSISEDYGLFGVSERNLSQLANIWKGDIVFYYTAHNSRFKDIWFYSRSI